MQIALLTIFDFFLLLIGVCSFAYLLFAIFSVELFNLKRRKSNSSIDFQPTVTILKPICGLDPELEENLRSFCQQNYPEYQVIFGIQDKNDPAIPIVKKIINEFKDGDVSYVIDARLYGTNHKISNLINMYPGAKYDYLLIADSDMRVPDDYLANVMAPFADQQLGAVTCLYSGTSKGKLASSLNAMFINEWFFPSVLISRILQPIKFCLGATMVIHRNVLNEIGGFSSLSNYLADDYMLGKMITRLGYKVKMIDYIVENIVEEASIKDLFIHELRWARTLKRVEPLGYALTFLTDTLVIAAVVAPVIYTFTLNIFWSLLPLFTVFLLRILLHVRSKQVTNTINGGSIWLIPLRDLLSFIIRIISFAGNSVQWRNNLFSVDTAGLIHTELEYEFEHGPVKDIPDLAATQDY
ncbi:MAG: bacteriohopanetetrol glucosamine biosynthesis glycosyltransferase HpnI [Proteobacteria bacterium]|nr:bacteriohopanetetrol glucosamine biosynthesis glycosyltransferase HpnI [Pseudomonadota bacterium]